MAVGFVTVPSDEPCVHCGALLERGEAGWEIDDGVLCRSCANGYDPQPEPCRECDGSGRSQHTTRGAVVDIDCPHCNGQGVTEP